MREPASRLLILALGLPLLAAVTAQDPITRRARTGQPAFAASRFAGVHEHAGAVLGVARSYRATFEDRAMTFQPALGRRAPEAATWRIELRRMARGDTDWLVAAEHQPIRGHSRDRVTYSWPTAPATIERYDVRADGVAQSFVLAERPRGAGDLTIDLDVTTTLRRAAGDGLAWRNPRGGGVTMGSVTGIDAAGRRAAGTITHTATGVRLALPAEFVDTAAYPLVVDPLIATAVEALAGTDCDFPDVAYDDYTQSYCVVWTQFLGGGQTGVVGSVFTATNLTFGYAFGVNQPGDEDSVRVCNIAGTGLFAMLWVNHDSQGSWLSGLAFEPTQATATNVFDLWGPSTITDPIVSGEATLFDDDCLVGWIDGTYGLLTCSLTIDQQLQVSATQAAQVAAGNVSEPAFSKQGGNTGLHVLTWTDRPPGSPGWIRAQVLDHDANLVGQAAWIRNVPENCAWPAVDGDGFRFLVAWEEQEAANPAATDIKARTITVGPAGITSLGGTVDLVTYPGDLDIAPDVAMLGDKFGLVFVGQAPGSPFFDDAYFLAVARDGTPIGSELRLDLTPGNDYVYEHAPRLIGHSAGNPATGSDEGLAVFADQSITTADSNVGLQAVEAMGSGGAITDQGGGCGPGGLAVGTGPFALGNTNFRCELFGAQPLAIPFLLLGLPGTTQSCGFCSYVQPLGVQFVANTAGYASAPLALPGDPGLVGVAIEFQFASFNVSYVGCIQAPGVAGSNIVRAVLDY
ncbi:MAG: hypothetical protein NXI31_06910 [bacterium]|nr:hypothetical protein [bacterium]